MNLLIFLMHYSLGRHFCKNDSEPPPPSVRSSKEFGGPGSCIVLESIDYKIYISLRTSYQESHVGVPSLEEVGVPRTHPQPLDGAKNHPPSCDSFFRKFFGFSVQQSPRADPLVKQRRPRGPISQRWVRTFRAVRQASVEQEKEDHYV